MGNAWKNTSREELGNPVGNGSENPSENTSGNTSGKDLGNASGIALWNIYFRENLGNFPGNISVEWIFKKTMVAEEMEFLTYLLNTC